MAHLRLDLDELVLQIREYQDILAAEQVIKPGTPTAQLRRYAEDLLNYIAMEERPGSLQDSRDDILLQKLVLLRKLASGETGPADAPVVEYTVQLLATDWIAQMHRRLSARLVARIEAEIDARE
ncbi:MAG: hypothetical protein ACYTG1_06540 [Planctomycetota bacterium]|jgi:hypothetical protein